MKITPLEIRQKTFEKNFRGYDKDEVGSFLVSLSQEWEKAMDEKKELQYKLEQAQKESAKLRDVEDSLFKTLKAAEDTGANMIEQANKTAELILKEAQMNADAMIAEAKNKSRNIIDSADNKARGIMEDLKEDVHLLVENYQRLQAQREMIIRNLKSLANDTLSNLQQSQEELKRVDIEAHSKLVKELSRKETFYYQERDPVSPEAEDSKETKPMLEVDTADAPPEVSREEPMDDQVGQDQGNSKEEPQADNTSIPATDKEQENPEGPSKKQSGSFFDQFD